MSDDGFLSRWARRKADARDGRVAADEAASPSTARSASQDVAPPAAAAGAELVPHPDTLAGVNVATPTGDTTDTADAPGAADPAAAEMPPTLEDVAALTQDSDYARFVRPGVDDDVKRAAMKKLFRGDPHFNRMDGLDVYIDDYGKPDPIPPSMLRQMAQAKFLGLFDDDADTAQAQAAAPATAPAAHDAAAPAVGPVAAETPIAHEDPDLRLQPDDAVGQPGTGDGTEGGRRIG